MTVRTRILATLASVLVVAVAGCGAPPAKTASPEARQVPLSALPVVDTAAVLAHTKVLSSDAFEGRGPGTAGEVKTVTYLVEQLTQMGLKPGNPDGTFVQKVPLVGITPTPANLTLRKGSHTLTATWKTDVVAWSKRVTDEARLSDSEVVFVGYGVQAPEFGWDDFKGLDVKGKTLLMLVNDPPVPEGAHPEVLDATVFGGSAMTYYGRWTYKYEMGAKLGAAAVLLIHETEPAGYGFNVVQQKTGEQFDLVTPDRNMGRPAIEGWVSREHATKLLALAGQNLDALKAKAATRAFTPVPLGVSASITLRNALRTIDSQNVVARLEGRDPALRDEHVIYTAHWDHFGVGAPVNGDAIYHGAKDNASGTAGILEIARAFTKLPAPPRRSILFLFVTAEEQGLLGSQYYAVTPLYPLAKALANINIDGLNVNGRTRDLVLIGLGASDLDDYARTAAAEQGRVITPDAEPEKGFYYRSDHFNFAKQGVPALDPDEGTDFIGQPPEFSRRVRDVYTSQHYHQPSDIVRPDWNLDGAGEDLRLFLAVGYRVAEAARIPEWKTGNEFKATRDRMLGR